MNSELIPALKDDQPQALLAWHKPEIQHLTVTLDTAFGGTSNADGDGLGLSVIIISDARVKQDISGITNALAGILALHGDQDLQQVYPEVVATRKDGSKAMNYALLVPVLVEAIKQQQGMIEDLQAQIRESR